MLSKRLAVRLKGPGTAFFQAPRRVWQTLSKVLEVQLPESESAA